MGYVRTGWHKKSTEVEVEVRNKRQTALLTPMPFVKINYWRGWMCSLCVLFIVELDADFFPLHVWNKSKAPKYYSSGMSDQSHASVRKVWNLVTFLKKSLVEKLTCPTAKPRLILTNIDGWMLDLHQKLWYINRSANHSGNIFTILRSLNSHPQRMPFEVFHRDPNSIDDLNFSAEPFECNITF